MPKASGTVELPFHVRWSEPSISYDLGQRSDRVRVYEQVLREGTEEDVRLYIEVDELVELFNELMLPPTVRRAWADWLLRHRGVVLACVWPSCRQAAPTGQLSNLSVGQQRVLGLADQAE